MDCKGTELSGQRAPNGTEGRDQRNWLNAKVGGSVVAGSCRLGDFKIERDVSKEKGARLDGGALRRRVGPQKRKGLGFRGFAGGTCYPL